MIRFEKPGTDVNGDNDSTIHMSDQGEQRQHAIDNAGSTEKLLTKAQVAQLCQVTERTIDAWMRNGSVVFYKIGRTVRFRWTDLQAHWDAVCRVGPRTRATSPTFGRPLEIEQRNGYTRTSCRVNHVARMQEEEEG